MKLESEGALAHRLSGVVEELLARREIRHAVVAIESGDQSFRWSAAVGEADPTGRPMTVDTPFFLASITKLYIATLVLKLRERAYLNLDFPIFQYLPRALTVGLHHMVGVDRTRQITVRHLLGHTSGLPDWLEDYPKQGPSFIERLFEGEDRTVDIRVVTEVVRKELTPHFTPQILYSERVKARYSDTNYQLLIAIVEGVRRKPIAELYEELFFRPLGLRNSWHPSRAPLAPSPPPSTLWVGDEPLDRPLLLASVGDLYGTATDSIAFLRALLSGVLFEDEATLALMTARWNRFGFPTDRAALRSPGWPIEYGLGIMRFRLPRLLTPLRAVPEVIGHTGSTGSWLFHAPKLDLYLAGTVDQATAGALPYRLVPKLLRILEEGL